MSQDVSGWVEIAWNPPDDWERVLSVGILVDRNRSLWSWLLQGSGAFPSAVPQRTLPGNLSAELLHEIEQLQPMVSQGEVHSFNWITWAEIENVDWSMGPKEGREPKSVEPQYVVDANGHQRVILVEQIYQTRQDTLRDSPGWMLLFDLMRRLADRYGGDNVRLVVWFEG